MSTFRKYAFKRFSESNRRPSLEQPSLPGFDDDDDFGTGRPTEAPPVRPPARTGQPNNTVRLSPPAQPSPPAEPDIDALSEIIHAVPPAQAGELLRSLNIGHRGGLTKKNFEPFRRKLLALVAHVSPRIVRHILAGDALFFKPIIDFWKAHVPTKPTPDGATSFALGAVNRSDSDTEPDSDAEGGASYLNVTQPTIQAKFALGDQIDTFPPSGSDLTHRLAWIMQIEHIQEKTLYETIRHYLTAERFHPNTVQYKNDTESIVRNHLSGGDVKTEPYQQGQLRSGLVALDNGILHAMADGQISNRMLSNMIDSLIDNKHARIRWDELQGLARIWLNQSQAGVNKYSLTEEIAKKLVAMFKNQRMI